MRNTGSGKEYNAWGLRSVLLKSEVRLSVILSILAVLLLIIFCFFNFAIPQTPGRIIRPSASLISDLSFWSVITTFPSLIPQTGLSVALLLIFLTVSSFIIYGLAVYLCWNYQGRSNSVIVVLLSSAFFFLTAVLALPNVNTDIYNYILRGRVAAVHNFNPYYIAADEFPDDPVYPYASHKFTKKGGGKLPAWMPINILLAKIAGDRVITNLLLYRFAFFLFNFANIVLIAIVLQKLNPRFLLSGMIFYAWNPIVVIYGQSKTDTVMAFYLTLAIVLFVVNWRKLSIVSMGLSVFVKVMTLPLVAIYWLGELRLRRWRSLMVTSLLLGLTAFIIYIPFSEDVTLIFKHLRLMKHGGSASPNMIRLWLTLAFVPVVFWMGLIQNGEPRRLILSWAIALLYFSFFLTKFSKSWYMMTPIAIVSLSMDWRLVLSAAALSFSSFLINSWDSVFSKAFGIPEIFAVHRFYIYLALSLILMIVIASLPAYQWLRKKNRAETVKISRN